VHGIASLKELLADSVQIDAGSLPYDEDVLAYIHEAREIRRPVYLASACNERLAKTVAEYLGVFDGVFASNHNTNLSAQQRRPRLSMHSATRGSMISVIVQPTFRYGKAPTVRSR
jgi:hypothetical protein